MDSFSKISQKLPNDWALGIGVARIFDWGGAQNHKSRAMTSSNIFERGTYCRVKIS